MSEITSTDKSDIKKKPKCSYDQVGIMGQSYLGNEMCTFFISWLYPNKTAGKGAKQPERRSPKIGNQWMTSYEWLGTCGHTL